jgi:hypothetical protein
MTRLAQWTVELLLELGCYGYVPIELAEPGTALAVHSEGADRAVTVVSEPRFDPEGARLREPAGAAAR